MHASYLSIILRARLELMVIKLDLIGTLFESIENS